MSNGRGALIELDCSNCGNPLSIPEKYAGQEGTCRKCGHIVKVPVLVEPRRPLGTQEEFADWLQAVDAPWKVGEFQLENSDDAVAPYRKSWSWRKVHRRILALAIVTAGIYFYFWVNRVRFPAPEEMQASGLWEVNREDAIFGGLSLTRIDYMKDTVSYRGLEVDDYVSLYSDDNDEIIALTAAFTDYPTGNDPGIDYADREDAMELILENWAKNSPNNDARFHFFLFSDLMNQYFRDPPLRRSEIRNTIGVDDLSVEGENISYRWKGFRFDLQTYTDDQEGVRYWLWTIRNEDS